MSETSGFFEADWDDEILNSDGTYGNYDRRYHAYQFADYFKLFIGNGVFGSPTNQCKVIPGTGLSVIVTAGWAFINGTWYHNDDNKEIPLINNSTTNNRVDTIRLRYSSIDKTILALAFTGDTTLVRGETVYDLKLADVIVPPNSVTVSAANITDTRMNESVCGFVTELLRVQTTEDLFSQYQAVFDEFFNSTKDQLMGDLGIRLQLEFDELNQNVIDYKNETNELVEQYQQGLDDIVEESKQIVADFVYNDYVIPETELVFIDRVCRISDSKVTGTSLIDVYFTADTIQEAEDCQIYVDSVQGAIVLTAERQPSGTIRALFRVRLL